MANTRSTRKARNAARAIDARQQVARNDLATAIALAVVPRVKGQRYIVEKKQRWGRVTLAVSMPVLDAGDVGVLLALLEIASGQIGDQRPGKTRSGLIPAGSDDKQNGLLDANTLRCETSIAEIARRIGRDSRDGRAARAIRESIKLLMMVTISAESGGSWGATHLLTGAVQRGGKIVVTLNYRATAAVLGNGQFAAVRMAQWRTCKGDLARVLLHRLAALTTGRLVPVYIDTLAAGCWADPPKTPAIKRYRRSLVRDAIRRGGAVPDGIKARIDGTGKVTFQRLAA